MEKEDSFNAGYSKMVSDSIKGLDIESGKIKAAVLIKPKSELLETLMEQGNVHEELNGDKYLYFPFCFKLANSGLLIIEEIGNVPDHVKAYMLKCGFKPNQ